MTITLLRFVLHVLEPFAVGAPEAARGGADRPAASAADGTIVVPPSSIAGSLRHHVHAHSPEVETGLFGPRAGRDDPLVPSPLRILGTALTRDGQPVTRQDLIIRRQTAIDRTLGAATTNTLRSAQLVPAGAQVDVFARLDRSLTAEDKQALQSWAPHLGWGRTVGQGRASVERIWTGALDLDNVDDLARWLLDGGPDLHRSVATTELPTTATHPIPWRVHRFEIADALHIAARTGTHHSTGPGRDRAPDADTENPPASRSTTRSNTVPLWRSASGRPAVEGSTFKGIVRSQACFILGSVGATDPEDHQMIRTLFGTTGQRGLLTFHSAEIEDARIEQRPHVAIDRLTSGPHDRHLYNYEVATTGHIELRIDSHGHLPDGAADLLDAVVRDLHDGLVGIGAHTTSGHGTIRLHDPTTSPNPDGDRLRRIALDAT